MALTIKKVMEKYEVSEEKGGLKEIVPLFFDTQKGVFTIESLPNLNNSCAFNSNIDSLDLIKEAVKFAKELNDKNKNEYLPVEFVRNDVQEIGIYRSSFEIHSKKFIPLARGFFSFVIDINYENKGRSLHLIVNQVRIYDLGHESYIAYNCTLQTDDQLMFIPRELLCKGTFLKIVK